jgi:hypothetical protein
VYVQGEGDGMTRDEANRIITEAMEITSDQPQDSTIMPIYTYPNGHKRLSKPDFFTPVGFFEVWNWAKDDSQHPDWKWNAFSYWLWDNDEYRDHENYVHDDTQISRDTIDIAVFPMKLAEWLKEKR